MYFGRKCPHVKYERDKNETKVYHWKQWYFPNKKIMNIIYGPKDQINNLSLNSVYNIN